MRVVRLFFGMLLWLFIGPGDLWSQPCNGSVQAGQDKALCFPGGNIHLTGNASAGYLRTSWSPATGLSNPSILNPILSLNGSGSYTYTLTASYPGAAQLIVNSDFSQGNTGFTSEHLYQPVPPIYWGDYNIGDNPQEDGAPIFCAAADHSPGSDGQMMIVDAATSNTFSIWCQEIDVQPNTDYLISCWILTIYPPNPPVFDFRVNGESLGNAFAATYNGCSAWEQYRVLWNSGSQSHISLCLYNANSTTSSGVDFALDDIEMRPLCEVSDEVTITVADIALSYLDTSICSGSSLQIGTQVFNSPIEQQIQLPGMAEGGCDSFVQLRLDVVELQLDVLPPAEINCFTPQGIELYGNVLNYPSSDLLLEWVDPQGMVISNSEVAYALTGGNYVFRVEYPGHNPPCSAEMTVFVKADTVAPVALAGADLKLGCAGGPVRVDATASDTAAGFSIAWKTQGGLIQSGSKTLTPVLAGAGLYILEIINPINGCADRDSLIVKPGSGVPEISIAAPLPINCLRDTALLDASASDQSNLYTYQWTALSGQILSGAQGLTPIVASAGEYQLILTDTSGPCADTAFITVIADTLRPSISILATDTLDCQRSSVQVGSQFAGSSVNLVFQWQGPGIVSPADLDSVEVNQPGMYYVEAVDTLNHCRALDSVQIWQNRTLPLADAGPDLSLTCKIAEVQLDGSASSKGLAFVYDWNSNQGNILSGRHTLTPTIDAPGWYYLSVADTLNGCLSTDSVEVLESEPGPEALIAQPDTLNCKILQIQLDATASTIHANTLYNWTASQGGNIVSGAQGNSPWIDAPGLYTLVVTDQLLGCSASASVLVIAESEIPQGEIAGPDSITCKNPGVLLQALCPDPDNLRFAWYNAAGELLSGGATYAITEAGVYRLQITDTLNGCQNTLETLIKSHLTYPEIALSGEVALSCINTEGELIANSPGTNLVYELQNADGAVQVALTANSWALQQAGQYLAIATDTSSGCRDTAYWTMATDTLPPALSLQKSNDLGCQFTSTLLEALSLGGDQLQYQWTSSSGGIVTPADQPQVQVEEPGLFQVLATNPLNGCSTQLAIEVLQKEAPIATLQVEQALCFGEKGSISFLEVEGGSAPYGYALGAGDFASESVFEGLDPGDYQLWLRDAAGCLLSFSATLSEGQKIEIQAGPEITIQAGESVQLAVNTNLSPDQIGLILWTPASGLSCTDCLAPIASPLEDTQYKLYIEDLNGCSSEAEIRLRVQSSEQVFIPNGFSPNEDGVNDVFFVQSNTQVVRVRQMQIFDRWGGLVAELQDLPVNDPQAGWDGRSRGQNLNPGVFVYAITVEYRSGSLRSFSGDVTLSR